MNTPVGIKIAKLLKEKKFDWLDEEDIEYANGKHFYCKHYKTNEIVAIPELYGETNHNGVQQWIPLHICAPRVSEIIMWLYEKHGIWIAVFTCKNFMFDVINKDEIVYTELDFNSPTEAYEAAIEYCLTELI
jgi:hypothetical protein